MADEIKSGGVIEAPEETTEQNKKPEGPVGVFIKQEKTDKPYWYVVHTYSGYENKVKANLEKAILNRGFEDVILEVTVPTGETIEMRTARKDTS